MPTKKIKLGEKVPDFKAPSTGNKTIKLSSLKGKNIVIYFYPRDATPGCTIEGQNFRDNIRKFSSRNTIILGVSRDSVKSHDKFVTKLGLTFPLLADTEEVMCNDYGVSVEKSMYGRKYMGIQRSTFLIDKNGVINFIWPKVKVPGHAKEVLEKIKDLK